ncbi:MAG: 5-formyltetrahydrofolate cyclo-ligase, partial [Bacilli bacterium]
MKQTKEQLRKQMIQTRKELRQSDILLKSNQIINSLITFLKDKKYQNILIYLETNNEVMTSLLTKEDFTIYVTKTQPDYKLKVNLYDAHNLVKHPYGYHEVASNHYIDPNLIEVVVIPGVSFSTKGQRIGYGQGYYDRFLAKYPHLIKVGLAYDFQIVSSIEDNSHDINMDYLISEKQ